MAIGDPFKTVVHRARLAYAVRGVLIIAVCAALAWASARHHYTADWTAAGRHTLARGSITLLDILDEPVSATAYVPDLPALRGREYIRDLFSRYQQHKPDLSLSFFDPKDIPDVTRAQGLRDGEIVLTLGARTEIVREYSEQAVTNALARLARTRERWIAFITGHGERHPAREANHDISAWITTLRDRGLKTGTINLAETEAIPDNANLVVIASPRVAYLPGEIALIVEYIENGGNLLWLSEPDEPPGMKALAAAVGVERIPGTIVDPVTQALGIDNPAITVVTAYDDHPAVAGFGVLTLFPYAAPIHERPHEGWRAARLLNSGAKTWSETAALTGNVALDVGDDFPGPLPLAVALWRKLTEAGDMPQEQRIIVIGDGDFIANTYIDNSGNRDLGVRLVDWLVTEDALIDVPPRVATSTDLALSRWQGAVIGVGFLFVLPLAFAANGILVWWRRRRA
jgi:ABC-type uncharacterized transport system involved in gliding motility auxiliary subunit